MLQIRDMKLDDYDAVYQLWKSTGSIELKKSDEREEIQRMLEWNPTTCLVGEIEGQIVAAVMGGFDGRRGMVHHLAVDPQYQNRGYGRRVLEVLEERFKVMGVIKVNLFVVAHNAKVLGFYEQMGYIRRDELITMSKTILEEY